MTTPSPQPNDELERAIKSVKVSQGRGDEYGPCIHYNEWAINQLLLAAKRLKEVEKENVEFRRTEPLKIQERNHWQGLVFDLIQVFSHDEFETEGEVIARMVKELQQLSTIRTEYKKALEASDKALQALRELVMYEHTKNNISVVGRVAINALKESLSTPLAIETMKGDKV